MSAMRWRRCAGESPNCCSSCSRTRAQPGRRQPLQELQDQRKLDRLAVVLAEQVRDRQVQRLRDLPQQQHRDVAVAGLELRQVALGHARVAGQDLARHAALGPHVAHSLAERLQERARSALGRWRPCLPGGGLSDRSPR